MKEVLENILQYRLKMGLTKEQVFEGVLFTMLSALNIEPSIAMAALDKTIILLKQKAKQNKALADLRREFD